MFLMDRFFDGTFLTFGIEVLSFADRDQEDRIDPMVKYKMNVATMTSSVFNQVCWQVYQVYFPQVRHQYDAMCILYTAP